MSYTTRSRACSLASSSASGATSPLESSPGVTVAQLHSELGSDTAQRDPNSTLRHTSFLKAASIPPSSFQSVVTPKSVDIAWGEGEMNVPRRLSSELAQVFQGTGQHAPICYISPSSTASSVTSSSPRFAGGVESSSLERESHD